MVSGSEEIGRRIADARDSAGKTQQALASEAGLERSALAKVERGLRGVSALELASIARSLGRRIEWFVQPATEAVTSHRIRVGSDSDVAAIDRALETIASDVELVQSLEPSLAVQGGEQAAIHSNADADALASSVRKRFRLDSAQPVDDLSGLVAGSGLLAFGLPLGPETADGGTVLLANGAVAVINSSNDVGRRRLTLAHELGHYLLADDYTVDWRVSDYGSSGQIEALIDRFARTLLLPERGLCAFWSERRERYEVRDAAILAGSHFHVDMSTLARRLQEVGQVSEDQAGVIRGARTTRADIIEHGLKVPLDLADINLPAVYEVAVLSQYRRQHVSAERALSLLQGKYDYEDLPEIPLGHPDALWSIIG